MTFPRMSIPALAKFRIGVYGVLIDQGRVLLTSTRVPSGVITNFPGGGLELGESPIEALQREFQEETGIDVTVGSLLFCSRLFQRNPEYPHEQLMHIYYLVQHTDGFLRSTGNADDVLGTLWVLPSELPSHRILEADLEFTRHPSFTGLF